MSARPRSSSYQRWREAVMRFRYMLLWSASWRIGYLHLFVVWFNKTFFMVEGHAVRKSLKRKLHSWSFFVQARGVAPWGRALPCAHSDLSSGSHTHVPITPAVWEAERGAPVESSGHKPSSRFRKRLWLKRLQQTAIEEDAQYLLLGSNMSIYAANSPTSGTFWVRSWHHKWKVLHLSVCDGLPSHVVCIKTAARKWLPGYAFKVHMTQIAVVFRVQFSVPTIS